jgi:hypothetical protein
MISDPVVTRVLYAALGPAERSWLLNEHAQNCFRT